MVRCATVGDIFREKGGIRLASKRERMGFLELEAAELGFWRKGARRNRGDFWREREESMVSSSQELW